MPNAFVPLPPAAGTDYLAAHPDWLPTVARWLHREWTRGMGLTLEQTALGLQRRLHRERVPLALVAHRRGRPVGTVSLTHGQRPDGAPTCCLAGLYVPPRWRRRGIGALLCRRAAAEVCRLSLPTLCLYTPDRAAYYTRLGWRETAAVRDTHSGVVESFLEPACSLTALACWPNGTPEHAVS